MSTRGPLITKIEPQPWPVELLTWVHTRLPDPAAPRVIAQLDWPNPVLPIPNLELRTWIQSPKPQTQTNIKGQWDWPNPVVRPWAAGLYTWIQTPALGPLVSPVQGFDWGYQLPIRPENTDLRTWIQSPTPARTPKVNAQYDWPNPQPRQPNLALFTWTQSPTPHTVTNPVTYSSRQMDWPNPQPKLPDMTLSTWIPPWQNPGSPPVPTEDYHVSSARTSDRGVSKRNTSIVSGKEVERNLQ